MLSEDFISNNIESALGAWNSSAWARTVPEHIFLDYVLPYSRCAAEPYLSCSPLLNVFPLKSHSAEASMLPYLQGIVNACSMDEDRDGCRHSFQPLVTPLVSNASSISEAALMVNHHLWSMWGIYFKPNQTPDILSPTQVRPDTTSPEHNNSLPFEKSDSSPPLQVAEAGYASCTGLSIFLVCALRSVGIPARVVGKAAFHSPHVPFQKSKDMLCHDGHCLQSLWPASEQNKPAAGTPAWKAGRPGVIGGNHDWVEVWFDGVWSFTGAFRSCIRKVSGPSGHEPACSLSQEFDFRSSYS